MEGCLVPFVLFGAAPVVYLVLWLRFRERAQAWRDAARRAGLTDLQTSTFMGVETKLSGRAGPVRVRLESYSRGKSEHGSRVVIGGLRHGSYALAIRPEGVTSAFEKVVGERELELGDEAFDREAYLQGAPALIRAIFDAETRRAMRALLGGKLRVARGAAARVVDVRASVSDDELRVDLPDRVFSSPLPWMPEVLRALLDAGVRLQRPDDIAAKIAANTRVEPVPAVRLANLQTLGREFPSHAATRDAFLAALADEDQRVRLQAAIALGPDGRQTLLDIAGRDDVPDAIAARAIEALGPEFGPERAIEKLESAIRVGGPAVARACISIVGAAGTPAGVRALVQVLRAAQPSLAVPAAEALGAAASAAGVSEEVEGALIEALGSESAEVRVAAANALARGGTPLSVVPLRNAIGAHPLDLEFRRAARQAIAQIQERVTGASPGQLSLAPDEAGQLALAEEDRSGRVSLEQDAAPPQQAAARGQQLAPHQSASEEDEATRARRAQSREAQAQQRPTKQ